MKLSVNIDREVYTSPLRGLGLVTPYWPTPILVSYDPEPEALSSSYNHAEEQKIEISRLATINKVRQKIGLKKRTSRFLEKAIRPETHKAYDNGWKRWKKWCNTEDKDP
ncbi:hypothetical protein INT47_010929 [Mucor saturninus]|uniref:Uncharacterized protein n=1 Tax=Mucor saturninus TaxID=64648 RepID=A0A8H7RCR4_9FUNG|nr:hypothetical protein INT47_010929 [Mucor saturninus]